MKELAVVQRDLRAPQEQVALPKSPSKAQIDWVRVGLLRLTRNAVFSVGTHDTVVFSAPTEMLGSMLLFLVASKNDTKHVRLIERGSRDAARRGGFPAVTARMTCVPHNGDASLKMQGMAYRVLGEQRLAARKVLEDIRHEKGEPPFPRERYDDLFIFEPYEALMPVTKEWVPSRTYAGETHQNVLGALRGFETQDLEPYRYLMPMPPQV